MRDANWIGRELRAKDKAKLVELLDAAHRSESLFVKAALARDNRWEARADGDARTVPTGDSWWFGVFRDGQTLEAVMFIENHQASVYASSEESAKALANEIYATQKRLGPTIQTYRHQITGEAKMMNLIWPIVKEIPGRRLVIDKDCELLQANPQSTTAAPSSRAEVVIAQRSDERAVSDFIAELRIEQLGIDPRKLGRDAHLQRVSDAIGQGRALLAKEKDTGRPYFCAELVPLDAVSATLNDVYVPPHYRSRGKLVAQAFWGAARHPLDALGGGHELLHLASDPTFANAAKAAGWKTMTRYRWVVTHG